MDVRCSIGHFWQSSSATIVELLEFTVFMPDLVLNSAEYSHLSLWNASDIIER